MDPRVKTSLAGLGKQFKLSQQLYSQLQTLAPATEQANTAHKQLKEIRQKLSEGTLAAAVDQIDLKVQGVVGGARRSPGAGNKPPTLSALQTKYLALFNTFHEVDAAPTTHAAAAVSDLEKQLSPLLEPCHSIKIHVPPALPPQLK